VNGFIFFLKAFLTFSVCVSVRLCVEGVSVWLWLRPAALRRVNPWLKSLRTLGSGLKAVCSISLVANEQRQFPGSAGKNE
jgi:hypothetical protein